MRLHIAPPHDGDKIRTGPYASRLRQNCKTQRADETSYHWRRRLGHDAMTAAALKIESDRLQRLIGRTERLRAGRIASGVRLRRAKNTGKHPPPKNSIERKAVCYDSIQYEIKDFTGQFPMSPHLGGTVPWNEQEQISAAHEAITRALKGFNQALGFKLSTYVKTAVKNAVRGAAKPRVRDAMADQTRLVFLSKPIGHDEDGDTITVGDTLTDEPTGPELSLPDPAWDYLRQILPAREFEVFKSRQQGESLQEIGKRLGFSGERIRQLELDAIARAADALRPEVQSGALVPVYGGGKGFQAEQWHLEGLQTRLFKSVGLKVASRELPLALERMAERGGRRWRPSDDWHLYPASLGKVYPPARIRVTDQNRAALRAELQTVGPLPTHPRVYTYISDDDPSAIRGRDISQAEAQKLKSAVERADREMVEVSPHQYVNRKAAAALGLVRAQLINHNKVVIIFTPVKRRDAA